MGHLFSTLQSHELSAAGIEKGFPPIIRVRYASVWSRLNHYDIELFLHGPNGEPMYTLDFEKGLYGDIVLHSGPSVDSPKLAVSGRKSYFDRKNLIRLPPISGTAPQDQFLYWDWRLRCFSFDIQVGHGPDQCLEGFEWRRSRGPEVKSVGQSSWKGLKLVRLGSTKGQGYGYSSDGNEVVAVWTKARSFSSFSAVGELQFLGSGATGELGQLWALMAVMSCMSIWQKVARDAARSSGKPGAPAGAGVGAGC
ncbi:hypothetical protein FCOIX_3506 [Fusarium coicis]|nr:hypothetical protein FCOIX_3506 [Fusarium coicis]